MTEQLSAYERLQQLTEGKHTKIDSSILNLLWAWSMQVENIDECRVPMLARVRPDSKVNWRQYAEIGANFGTILTMQATPEQLIKLLELDDVTKLELSGSGGPFDSSFRTR